LVESKPRLDSGAWADPTADAIFTEIVRQVAARRPLFFANLGDFAGPGTRSRHADYLALVEPLEVPNICVVGNHDLDGEEGRDSWLEVHGPMNFSFVCGHTRFVAIHAATRPGSHDDVEDEAEGPQPADLDFLDSALAAADEPNRVVLMHMPPYLGGHYAPHPNWGFRKRETEFLRILRTHSVKLVCCAHGLAFDEYSYAGIRFVMSGGGGTGLCSHMRGICTEGDGTPETRGALFHFVEIAIAEDGAVSGRVFQAFGDPDSARIEFSD
jgi:hypothetical protein